MFYLTVIYGKLGFNATNQVQNITNNVEKLTIMLA